MPLKKIGLLDTPVSDITPLEGCPSLESVVVPTTIKNLDRVKRLPSLNLINNLPPAEFWQERQGGEPDGCRNHRPECNGHCIGPE